MSNLASAQSKLLFLLLLLSQLCTDVAVCRSIVKFLPGYQGPLPFELETGYVGVGDSEDAQLFYYFIKSEGNPKEDPLILWLNGGPGCTGLNGLLYQIGPLNFNIVEYNGSLPTLVLNPNSWTKIASILFLDSPVGTGFSYARTPLASQTSDSVQNHQISEFLRKWLMDHPEFLSTPFYVAGDSYSGMTVPGIVEQIINGNEENIKPLINLQGYILGNPETNAQFDKNSVVPFAYGVGILSHELYESLKRTCGGQYQITDATSTQCLNGIQAYQRCISGLNPFNILDPMCSSTPPEPQEIFGKRRSITQHFSSMDSEIAPLTIDCHEYRYLLSVYWANDKSVQKALNIREKTIGEWTRCNHGLNYTKDISSSLQYHVRLSTKGYRSLIFSGDRDMMVPFLGTEAWIRSLNYLTVESWRQWIVNMQVAGFTKTYSNKMTFATVKDAGHVASEYKPAECFAMFSRWILHEPL